MRTAVIRGTNDHLLHCELPTATRALRNIAPRFVGKHAFVAEPSAAVRTNILLLRFEKLVAEESRPGGQMG